MRELEEALMDRTTASLNRKKNQRDSLIEPMITPTYLMIDLAKDKPLSVIT